ncbi:MAG TPA: hypothetical protein VNH19_19185 [Candidatus Limnocylindrales bacterium]|jgi:hypothetical protein|nr:hypothetical protein [Candidatus Limnocylindrales bacterium]
MLRVEIRDSADTLILRLEGRFTGDDAEHTRTLAARFAGRGKLLVDLTEVVFIDAVGEEVLRFLGRFGAEFVAPNSYALDVCERLNLRVVPNGSSYLNALGKPPTNGDQSHPNKSEPRKRVTTSEPTHAND